MNAEKKITSYSGILFACWMLMVSHVSYAGISGDVQFVSGNVQGINAAGQAHVLQKGDAINENDTVATGKDASAQIKMRDGGLIAVRPDSKLKFDSFVFSGEQDGSEKSIFTLLRGGMRAITGLVGQLHKANYRVNTISSTIGIRGTDHEIYVVVPGSALAATVPTGTYNKVNTGGTVMTTDQGAINIEPNQMGFAAAKDQLPQLQPINLNIFTVTPPPMPQAKGGAVRDGTVVDASIQIQGQDVGTGMVTGNIAPASNIHVPITATYGGVAAPPVTVVF